MPSAPLPSSLHRTSDTPRLLSLAARVLPSLSHERCAQLAVALAQMDTMDDTLRAGLAQRVAQQVAQVRTRTVR